MISKRLKTIASLINKGQVVADIGSDHGLLAIYLIKEALAKKVYAIDNKSGPLSFGKANVKAHNLESKIQLILANGLEKLPADTDVVVIAGMGYTTIRNIIENDLAKVKDLKQIIIQANNQQHLLRALLLKHNFEIIEEVFIHENNQDYFIVNAKYTSAIISYNTYVSDSLLTKADPNYLNYLKKRLKVLKKIKQYRSDETIDAELMAIKKAIN